MDKYFGNTANVKFGRLTAFARPLFRALRPGYEKSTISIEFKYHSTQNLTFAVSPKYLSNETKIYIFITRRPRGVYIIFSGFFLPLVDIYRHPLLKSSLLQDMANLNFSLKERQTSARFNCAAVTISKMTSRSCEDRNCFKGLSLFFLTTT